MKVLVVGGGGREHALIWKLSQSPRISKLYCAPGNGGIAGLAECVNIKATDVDGIAAFAVKEAIDYVVVAPDDPLMLGMVDRLEALGIRAFGPRQNAAIIEGSKVFSKQFMKRNGIPTADFEIFTSADAARAYIREKGAPLVVKADGLALGKGVTVAQTANEAQDAVSRIMEDRVFGASGASVVIEECLAGPEVSVLCFTDGETVVLMPSAQDHKRIFDGDLGPNTGGMGAISPSRHYTPEIEKLCLHQIIIPTIRAMKAEGRPFKGVLYFGLMLTPNGPVVIEYNARFGDPETQPLMLLLKTDLLDLMEATTDGRLADVPVEWYPGAAACVVMASGGYPGKYNVGAPILGLSALPEDIVVFHAGTKLENGCCVTSGGRVLGVTACADTLDLALSKVYEAVGILSFEGAVYRNDIGKK